MSIEIHVFMQDARVPSRDEWQQAIAQLGFPTVLCPTLDVRADTGFSPTTYKAQRTGFEFDVSPAADVLSSYPHVAAAVGNRDRCATFRWGGDLTECAAALSAAAALVKVTDGLYFYPDDDTVLGADDAVEALRSDLASM